MRCIASLYLWLPIPTLPTANTFSGEAQSQVILQENATIDQQVHVANQSTVESGGGVHGVVSTNSKGYHSLANIVAAFTSLLLISFNINM